MVTELLAQAMSGGQRLPESRMVLWEDGRCFHDSASEVDSSSSDSSRSKDNRSKSKRKGKKEAKSSKKVKEAKKHGGSRKTRKTTSGNLSSRYTTWKKVPVAASGTTDSKS